MDLERERLLSLIEFASQAARLKNSPAASVADHRLFSLYEDQVRGLPGLHLNPNGSESEDEIWLSVERLHETKAPETMQPWLVPWLVASQNPAQEPRLREAVTGAVLIEAGTHSSSAIAAVTDQPAVDPDAVVGLASYERAEHVRAQFTVYLQAQWRPWAEQERHRRNTIRLYAKLFTLMQQLEGGILETPLEIVWGAGIGIWRTDGVSLNYPLVTRLVEMSLNPVTAALEIRPRDVDAELALDWYAAADNPGVPAVERAAKEFFRKATTTFSPFDRGTFEPILRTASTNLDVDGIFWPDEVPAEDRSLPTVEDKLKVTDTWVLFARPRTNSVFLQDLERLKKRTEEAESYPPAVAAVVTEPKTSNAAIELPSFRGVSASHEGGQGERKELYFPKPFNDEQVRIVQLLEVSDGVVVQGPPGTGKTHTIANVICHYLADGKRVLVTSMKDPALAVLQEQLPLEIRPLAIALLTSEQEGMKQFEHAIHRIASEIQGLDRTSTMRAIAQLEDSVGGLHARLASIDRRTTDWATRNLAKVVLDGEELVAQDAAQEVVEGSADLDWFPDPLGIGPEFAPQCDDADIIALREARRTLGGDIEYLGTSLPQLAEFPDSKTLLQVHQDLSQFERLQQGIESGEVPSLLDSSQDTLSLAQQLLTNTEALERSRQEINSSKRSWTDALRDRFRSDPADRLLAVLEDLGKDLDDVVQRRTAFVARPVSTPEGAENDIDFLDAVANLAEGRSPFGIRGVFGKSAQKRRLESVTVLASQPRDTNDWKFVSEYLALLKRLNELSVRWNALARELPLETVHEGTPGGSIAAVQAYELCRKIKAAVLAEAQVAATAAVVFPRWPHAPATASDPQRLAELQAALRHHLTKNRLANVLANKERCQAILTGRTGRVVDHIRVFLSQTLGNPKIDDGQLQASWTQLTEELSRVLGLAGQLEIVKDTCTRLAASGAPRYAALLEKPLVGTVDHLLPDNWRRVWRLRRLATYLASIDPRDDLKKLAKERYAVAGDLARTYRDIVVKRTWLKLAENASPRIRSALQAYLAAIQKIGKGSGKRAIRYRQDARAAASEANPAVPCWIMAHHRVSESLPAELGCFDLVIVDEASQSDLAALPSLLRAKKVLIVGDDKQVSPEAVGLEEKKVLSLMSRFLGNQVVTFAPLMSPDRSIYDLFKVVFATSTVMLKEHFRCVGPIIEYSKREFYNHELRPLRLPKASERLDPPLVDVLVEDGYRNRDENRAEARFIVDEISRIVADPRTTGRSIGVVSLLGDKQALSVWERLTEEVGPEIMQRHRIACGDARTFQGKERDVMFLSMIVAPNDLGAPLSRDIFAQRFNVAGSRARDRMYLVRSVALEQLREADHLRRALISHFALPFTQDESRVENLRSRCESPFEREVYDELTQRGYWVTPQVPVGHYRIDMVVEGHNDARLAIECDGDKYHGAEKWADDMQRQRVLERAGWVFWRCFASAFIRRRKEVLNDLLDTLKERGIDPVGPEGERRSVHVEHRVVNLSRMGPTGSAEDREEHREELGDEVNVQCQARQLGASPVPVGPAPGRNGGALAKDEESRASEANRKPPAPVVDMGVPLGEYVAYSGLGGPDPRTAQLEAVAGGLARIVEFEGPVIGSRVYETYLRGCGIARMGHELKSTLNKALAHAIRSGEVVAEDEDGRGGYLYSVLRSRTGEPIKLRTRGPRSFDEIPSSELQLLARYLVARDGCTWGSEEHLRAILDSLNLTRLTTQVSARLRDALDKKFPKVDACFSEWR